MTKRLLISPFLVKFLTFKCNEIRKERKEKDELINIFLIEVSFLKVKVKNLEKKADDQKQYLRRN